MRVESSTGCEPVCGGGGQAGSLSYFGLPAA